MQDKVVIVTGAFGALGRVVAGTLAARGARLGLVDAAGSVPEALAQDVGFDGIFLDTVDDVTIYPETFDGMVSRIEPGDDPAVIFRAEAGR